MPHPSGEMADFPEETHNWADLSGETGIFPDDNGNFRVSPYAAEYTKKGSHCHQ